MCANCNREWHVYSSYLFEPTLVHIVRKIVKNRYFSIISHKSNRGRVPSFFLILYNRLKRCPKVRGGIWLTNGLDEGLNDVVVFNREFQKGRAMKTQNGRDNVTRFRCFNGGFELYILNEKGVSFSLSLFFFLSSSFLSFFLSICLSIYFYSVKVGATSLKRHTKDKKQRKTDRDLDDYYS